MKRRHLGLEKDFIELDLRTVWNLIRKNIVLIAILTFAGGLGSFFISTYLISPQYEASVTLAVNTRDEAATIIASDQINAARQLVNTYAVILTNDTLLDEIIHLLRLDYTISTLNRRISAEAVNQTQVMKMTMRDRNPNVAKAVLDIIMSRAEDLLITTVKAGSVEIVSPPRINFDPVSPRIGLNTVIGAGIGLFVSLVFIFIRKALSNTFISEEDVARHLDLPVIGVIPSLNIQEQRYG
jgi:capsular polysaccharide biosynthesis protein